MPAVNGNGLYGVGFDSKGKWKQMEGGKKCKCYKVWRSMLMRCYQKNHHEREAGRTYSDAFVNPEWHDYQNFAEWWHQNYIDGWEIDKDILISGNREYGPNTCVMVPRELNSLFKHGWKSKNNNLPMGVHVSGKKFGVGYYSFLLGRNTTASFTDVEDAIEAYDFTKARHIYLLILKHRSLLDDRVVDQLELFYKKFL